MFIFVIEIRFIEHTLWYRWGVSVLCVCTDGTNWNCEIWWRTAGVLRSLSGMAGTMLLRCWAAVPSLSKHFQKDPVFQGIRAEWSDVNFRFSLWLWLGFPLNRSRTKLQNPLTARYSLRQIMTRSEDQIRQMPNYYRPRCVRSSKKQLAKLSIASVCQSLRGIHFNLLRIAPQPKR